MNSKTGNAKTELDSSGLLVKTDTKTGEVLGTALAKHPQLPPALTMRSAIRKLSNNGSDYLVTLDNIARGTPFVRTLPPDDKGKQETFTVFPSLEHQAPQGLLLRTVWRWLGQLGDCASWFGLLWLQDAPPGRQVLLLVSWFGVLFAVG